MPLPGFCGGGFVFIENKNHIKVRDASTVLYPGGMGEGTEVAAGLSLWIARQSFN